MEVIEEKEEKEGKNTISIDELPSYTEMLALDWTLSSNHIRFILNAVKGENQILYFAAQLKSLENTGNFINVDDKNKNILSDKIINYLSKQLGLTATTLTAISINSETLYRQKIKDYLNYREYADAEEKLLEEYILVEMQKEFFSLDILQEKGCNFLKANTICRPAPTVLERAIASSRKKAQGLLYEKLARKLTIEQQEKILLMLKRQPNLLSQANYYKKSPPEPTAQKINMFILRFKELNELGITTIDFSDISEAIFEKLELLGRTYDVNTLSHLRSKDKKVALLLCTLVSASQSILDHIVEMNNHLLLKKERISGNLYSNTLKSLNKNAKKGLNFLIKTTKRWLDHDDPENTTLSAFKQTVNDKEIRDSMAACEELNTYQSTGYYEILENKYNDLRKYTVNLFDLDFKGTKGTESILSAMAILKTLNQNKSTELPKDTPMDFIPKAWRKAINKNDIVSRRTWEMALYYAVKNNIEKGDIYLEQSKKHKYFWNTVYSDAEWKTEKPFAFNTLGFTESFHDMLAILKKEYAEGIALAKHHLDLNKNTFAYIDKGELKLRKEDALYIPDSTKKLKKLIESKMGIVRIEEILSDLDKTYQFSRFFVSPEGFEKKLVLDNKTLYAAIVALGTNLGFVDMANSTLDIISLEKLKHVAQWCIRPDVINEANDFLIKKHSEHPLAQLHGDFTWSGSDGDRFCIQKSTNLASFYPKAFGYYQKVITIYTHLSDQYSVFSTQVISCGLREASYVLNGLLNNQMINNMHFHCTDTGGYTHQLFALCYLLKFSFQPRLKDLTNQTLYKIDKNDHYGEIDSIFNGYIDMDCIAEQWEQLIRIIASLKNQVAPAHLVLQKLSARGSSDRVSKAMMELGKLIKTIYILHYISKPDLRRKVQLQLNRGESRHYLARHIFFGNQGEFKTADYEEIMNIASCLSLLSNAVLLWNTPRIYAIVEELRRSGTAVDDEDIKRVSLLLFKHLIVHGTYDFRAIKAGGNYASN